MRYRLRYMNHDLELSEGQFVIGRSAGCQLSLDDPLVSRRHAVLVVAGDAVTIEDEQSRNGVIVNGEKVVGRIPVAAGDRIVIGSQELTLLGSPNSEKLGAATQQAAFGKQTLTQLPALPRLGADRVRSTSPPLGDPDVDTTTIRRAKAFQLLAGVAEKALAMGRADEAERLLAVPLSEVLDSCRAGKVLTPALVDAAARFASKLATAMAKGAWVDFVVELYQAQARPCPAPVIDELNTAVRKVSAIDLVRLRDYLALLHEKQATLGPAERFLLQRIEGLERLAALR
jgi:predicted component of type VI protein secretion system